MIGREIDVESQKALRKVKHSCSEVIRALTLRFEGRSGIDRKIHAQLSRKPAPPGGARTVTRHEGVSEI